MYTMWDMESKDIGDVWVFCEECVWKIYGCKIDDMEVKYSK